MKDAYTNAFYEVARETQETTGYELPHDVEAYIVMLLGTFVDRPNFLPNKSFAESLLSLRNNRLEAKQLGDVCLFVSGVFPEYGMKKPYYISIGRTSYGTLEGDVFISLTQHFDFLSDFIHLMVRSKRNSLPFLN
jgi:hypothetical protein